MVVVEFDQRVVHRMELHASVELERARTPDSFYEGRNEDLLDRVAELSDERIAEEVRFGVACPYRKPARDVPWNSAITGVNITRLDDRPALRVETRFGDYGGMNRVVAWLEACGGKRVP